MANSESQNAGPGTQIDPKLIEQARKQVNRLADEIARLSEMEMSPGEYFGEFLQRVLAAVAAPAGAIWIRTAQGNLQLQYQIRMREVGLDAAEHGRKIHDELLREVVMKGQPALLAPQSGLGETEGEKLAPGNPTDYVTLIAPIMVDKDVAGLVEIWQEPNRGPDAQRGFLQFLIKMAGLASNFTRNTQLRQMSNQQQVWTQLESFSRQVHASLNPTEVAYQIANEGRRLVECDRISVGLRDGGKVQVRAISGADVVEKRSNLVRLMRDLFEHVANWGEKLVYSGTKDETLPPKVLRALDAYLAESNSKLMVVMPLRDDREKNPKRPPRSAIMMECFEPNMAPEQMVARLDVVAKHATSALYNSSEHRRIPFRFIWGPMAAVQEGLGGKTKAIVMCITFAVVLLIMAMIFVPYPLKMEANGKLLPKQRSYMFPPIQGHVVDFKKDLKSGSVVTKGMELMRIHSLDWAAKIRQLELERDTAKKQSEEISNRLRKLNPTDQAAINLVKDQILADATYHAKNKELEKIYEQYNADRNIPGLFRLVAPRTGVVLTGDFRENLLHRFVNPSEPLIRIGFIPPKNLPKFWEIELKIPQKHVGQVLAAFENVERSEDGERYLDVDFLLVSQPTAVYKGKLAYSKVSKEAIPDKTDNNESEPVVKALVNISSEDIPEESRVPISQLLTGTEVHARVRCGNHPMGYSLFYGVWEFIYEKVVFFF